METETEKFVMMEVKPGEFVSLSHTQLSELVMTRTPERQRYFHILRERRLKKVEELKKIKAKKIDDRIGYWFCSVPCVLVWLLIVTTNEGIEALMTIPFFVLLIATGLLYFAAFVFMKVCPK